MLQYLQSLIGGKSSSVKTESLVFSVFFYVGLLLFGRNIFEKKLYLIDFKIITNFVCSWGWLAMDAGHLWFKDQMPQSQKHGWVPSN